MTAKRPKRDPMVAAWRRQLVASIHAGHQAQFRLDVFLGRLDGLPEGAIPGGELATLRSRLFELTRALRAVQRDLARIADQELGPRGITGRGM